MKRKADFVTNSSSCSFVLIGWMLDRTRENAILIAKALEEGSYDNMDLDHILHFIKQSTKQFVHYMDDCDSGLKYGKIYIGHYIRIPDDDSLEDEDLSIIEAVNNERLIKNLGLDNLSVITGTSVC